MTDPAILPAAATASGASPEQPTEQPTERARIQGRADHLLELLNCAHLSLDIAASCETVREANVHLRAARDFVLDAQRVAGSIRGGAR